jgi:type III secretion protein Q
MADSECISDQEAACATAEGTRARPRAVPRNAVGALNRLAGAAQWTSIWRGQPWHLRLDAHDAHHAAPTDIVAALSWSGMRACLIMSHANAEALFAAHYGLLATAELADDLMLALLQDTADKLAAGFPAPSGAVRIEDWCGRGTAAAMPFRLALHLSPAADGESFFCHLLTDLHGLRKLASRCERRNETAMLAPWADMPAAVTLELGWVDLRMDQLASVKPQDVLLPDAWWHTRDLRGVCIRISPALGIEARAMDSNLLQATTKVKSMEQEPFAHPEDEAAHAAGADSPDLSELADVPMRITFDIGEHHLTLHELAGVAPGHVFDLGLAPERAVNLRVNGMRIGEGELVDIDGRIGVAVTRITAPRR